ncbi:MAG: hypothetical protein JXB17_11530, partial [Bacteroidales bacterium]|nr:hypothetical protein [Bacteroidales bacterium]
FISSGSGHVFAYDLKTKKIDWDFYIGSDMDGSPVITADSCIIVTIEKQYIQGNGGVMKLNPFKKEEAQVEWFFPTDNVEYSGWEGGVIGSAGITDYYDSGRANLTAFIAIDGYLYVVNHKVIDKESSVKGPNLIKQYCKPYLIFKKYIGPSISTPIFVNNVLIAASYNGIYLFKFDNENNFKLMDKFEASFEATPIAWNKKIYIASRNGFLYCFGN